MVYPAILKQHKVDSAVFYSTFNIIKRTQRFFKILALVDSTLFENKTIRYHNDKPRHDTTTKE